jgi:serine/threonine protein kinase
VAGAAAAGAGASASAADQPEERADVLAPEEFSNLSLIGSGGNADVYWALWTGYDGEPVALKMPRLPGGKTLNQDVIDEFFEEVEMWAQLDDHTNVLTDNDWGEQPLPWLAMEYMDGGPLGEYAGRLSLDQSLWTALSITEALYHAHHRGVAHLDLKPGNILFKTAEDDWNVPKVADWGLAKMLLDHSQSVEGFSPQYAAPEQIDEDRGVPDQQTDIYQLGTVFYELFTGQPPFTGETAGVLHKALHEEPTPPSELAPRLPPELESVIQQALAKEKADRYEDISLLRKDLQEIYDDP